MYLEVNSKLCIHVLHEHNLAGRPYHILNLRQRHVIITMVTSTRMITNAATGIPMERARVLVPGSPPSLPDVIAGGGLGPPEGGGVGGGRGGGGDSCSRTTA